MVSVDAGFTAIQKSVFECAVAGCKTIWIVANSDLAPVVRHCVGDWVYDPVYYNRTKVRFYREVRKEIPIYYVPIDYRDTDRRDSYGWSVLHGVNSAWWVGNKISKWLVPEKYFISFPMSAHDIYSLREHRKEIADPKANFFLTYDNKTVKDNLPLSFAMKGEDYIQCRRKINKETTREFLPPLKGEKYPSRRLPLQERWSAKGFDFRQVFGQVDTSCATTAELEWFYDISAWKEYRKFLGSEHSIKKPYKGLTGPHKHATLIE
tara:strand:+ start:354 stop:1145 length:792 start_codon:yes stop_codon:yes gene_type:complete